MSMGNYKIQPEKNVNNPGKKTQNNTAFVMTITSVIIDINMNKNNDLNQMSQ